MSLFLCAALLAAPAAPQDIPDPAPLASLEGMPLAEQYVGPASQLVGRALTHTQAFEVLEVLCNVIGPRLTGSENADRAVDWCVQRLRQDGFQNVRREPVLVPVWRRGEEEFRMLTPRPMKLVGCALGGSIGTDGPLTGELVMVADLEDLATRSREEIEGKIVFFNARMKPSTRTTTDYGTTVRHRSRGAIEAARLGAIASVIRSVGTDRQRLPHTGAMNYEDGVTRIPGAAVAQEDADVLATLARRGETITVSLDMGCHTLPDQESFNVVAEVVGREKPEEIVVIGGHLDSWDLGTGALDDGAGCVIAWEAARLMLETGLIPRRTVRLVLFMNEENGLRGGRQYAAAHREEMGNHVAAIEADSGAGRPLGFGASTGEGGMEPLQQAAALLQGIGAGRLTRGGGGADISPMAPFGVPMLGLRNDMSVYFDYHHTPADTLDKVDPHDLARNIAAMAVMTYVIADLAEALPRLN